MTNKIKLLQKRLYCATGSRASLDAWQPHLTIGSGVAVSSTGIKQLRSDFKYIVKNFKSFKIFIKDFTYMDNWSGGKLPRHTKYLVGLGVVVNKNLSKLAQVVKVNITNKYKVWYEQPWPYHPHLTIAYKDLSESGFYKAKEILKKEKFNGVSLIDHLGLAQKNKDGIWKKYAIFKFKK